MRLDKRNQERNRDQPACTAITDLNNCQKLVFWTILFLDGGEWCG